MTDRGQELSERVEQLEREMASLRGAPCGRYRGVRKRSEAEILGLPLWEIATGPDPEKGEIRGHAKAIIAIGDIATGFLAIGGAAAGGIAMGGGAAGYYAFGGGAYGEFVVSATRRDPQAIELAKTAAAYLGIQLP